MVKRNVAMAMTICAAPNNPDKLTPNTKMIHNTRRRTQPWKTGLKVDYTPTEFVPVIGWIMRMRRKMFGEHALLGRYSKHPDPKQEQLFSVVEMGPSSLLTVDLDVEISLPVPNVLMKKIVNEALDHLADNLKSRAEQLASGL